ncbi:hypothetical protein DPMN_067316 [Dreissena polymorpha]|uniref:Uncharacterized protein n=1 Tax=Dreissena polymorpha TaxID=45954 RepID=A0A9D4BTH7_DREPO|nr:hypothetical protein DPMN_067316 [Dreissena polymorpha]
MKEIMREHALKEKQEKARRLAEGRRASTNEVALSASAPQATTSITAAIPVVSRFFLDLKCMRCVIHQYN